MEVDMDTQLSDNELKTIFGGQTSVNPQITDFISGIDSVVKDLAKPMRTVV